MLSSEVEMVVVVGSKSRRHDPGSSSSSGLTWVPPKSSSSQEESESRGEASSFRASLRSSWERTRTKGWARRERGKREKRKRKSESRSVERWHLGYILFCDVAVYNSEDL